MGVGCRCTFSSCKHAKIVNNDQINYSQNYKNAKCANNTNIWIDYIHNQNDKEIPASMCLRGDV